VSRQDPGQDAALTAVEQSTQPYEFRTNGVVTNMPEYYTAFGVKEGDKLYRPPDQRVAIW
jgi:predicted metalloendopeptidase